MKILLTCALTTEKIEVPVRGIFCKHFQCFDLRNYLILTSQAQNPRWKCPICSLPAYELLVDCIFEAILKTSKDINTK
jgi:hypothetical protein